MIGCLIWVASLCIGAIGVLYVGNKLVDKIDLVNIIENKIN